MRNFAGHSIKINVSKMIRVSGLIPRTLYSYQDMVFIKLLHVLNHCILSYCLYNHYVYKAIMFISHYVYKVIKFIKSLCLLSQCVYQTIIFRSDKTNIGLGISRQSDILPAKVHTKESKL